MGFRRSRSFAIAFALVLPFAASASAQSAPPDSTKPAVAGTDPKPTAKPQAAANPKTADKPQAAANPKTAGGIETLKRSALAVTLEIKAFTLANGLRVYVVEDHSTPALTMQTVFGVGSRDEVEGRTGFAHFFEHMMFKGSKNVPDGGHMEYIKSAGGSLNAFTANDLTQYFNTIPSRYLDRVLWLESDRMRSLAITEETFENQRKAVQEEKAMRYDNQPYARAMEEFFTEIWKGTGYGHSGIGTDEDLAAAKTADVQEFFAKHYTPNNAIIAIVGDVSAEDVQQKVQQYYGDIPRGPERASQEAIDHTQIKLERKVEDKLAKQPIYVMGWKTVPADHPDRHALDLLAAILLRGDSARITKILKDDKKMILASFPLPNQASGGVDAGALLAGFVPVQGTSFADIQKVVNAEFAKAKSRGVKKNELQKAINQITVDTLDELATNFGRSYGVAQGVALHGDPAYSLAELERYQKVTTSDIKRVARKYLTDKTMTLEVVPGQ